MKLLMALVRKKMIVSLAEGRRLISGGGVRINGVPVNQDYIKNGTQKESNANEIFDSY